MPIRWSSIHEQLGETPRDLDFAMLRAAVDAKLTETESLDWKKALPAKGEEPAREFAKDVAAMANTRGGLIVYGVEEESGTAAAKAFASIDNSDTAQRRLRQLAANGIHPMVPGLQCLPLESDDGTDKVLVLAVPRSADAPHVIGVRDRLGLPFRDGAGTGWLREREIERAYAERFAGRQAQSQRLAEMINETAAMLDMERSAWLVGVCRPRTPLPAVADPLAASAVRTVLETVLRRTSEMFTAPSQERFQLIREVGNEGLNPRTGLRRWVVRIPTTHDTDMRSMFVHIELHHDGSAVLAAQVHGWGREEPEPGVHKVLCPVVESFAADFAALSETYASHLGGQVPMAYQCELLKPEDLPLQVLDLHRLSGGIALGGYQPVPGSWTLRQLVPVNGEFPIDADAADVRAAARAIALDIVNQFGVPRLHLFE
ncbi:ATP-binding protein [Actinoplanes sp. NBRC 103695]|uniref:AlbA family DNA-binding domain-containing protein n=1 Tax=Actinoplanes sp. NBRC 103695 TaxID=3032202 RepID=UPI0024A0A647|nr:ATP-binding protein [Actinoplanes sp. NBRC 103695]GLY99857.1 hypothetical protein Acsp02_71100 [Actinoplanes sp. NBRC 103695]